LSFLSLFSLSEPRLAVSQPDTNSNLLIELSEVERKNLISKVMDNFWGVAMVGHEQYASPKNELERKSPLLSDAESNRIITEGMPAGLAMWCDIAWRPYYKAFMRNERRKSWNDNQIAFIGMLFGISQQTTLNKKLSLDQTHDCNEEFKQQLTRELTLRIERLSSP